MSTDKHRIGFHLFACQWCYSIHVSCGQKVIETNSFRWNSFSGFSFPFRASREEMLQRAGVSSDSRGPRVPDGPPVNTASDKGFTFTQLP